ncbi:MAG: alpha/beta hydrolase [Planctomycetes bacterium]|nr:alpha/beta hydrolase [Planctomycetota bacterium]
MELHRVETADGWILDGALWPATTAPCAPLDAFLLIHGTGSNFYASGVLETFARQAVAGGTSVLRINTRGHDGLCTIPTRQGSQPGGATHERIHDCVHDLTAWVDWLQSQGFRRVILVGHSMGGVKAVLSQAAAPHTAVAGIVGISPPRFSHARLLNHPRGMAFREEFNRARQFVDRGQPEQLLPVTQPLPFLATAAGYVEKYGPEDRYDYVPKLAQLPCPTLLILGGQTLQTSPAFGGLDTDIAAIAATCPNVQYQIVDGANINYAGCDHEPFLRTKNWWQTILPKTPN